VKTTKQNPDLFILTYPQLDLTLITTVDKSRITQCKSWCYPLH